MKRSQVWILLGLILVLSVPFLSYSLNLAIFRLDKQSSEINYNMICSNVDNVSNITLILNYNDGENITFNNIALIGDISPFNATIVSIGLENISYYTAINGVFVKGLCINGIWYMNQPTGRNWLYYVNGQLAGISCSILKLNSNSVIEWIFKSGNPIGEDTDPNDDFWLYAGIFIGIAAICVVGIYLIIRKGI
ncbi:MAG TPA: DUF4430 domain-containing protein [Candidatus Deferrimicrobium sp.]|nr:DUF4430 domain-containing protein [Candidatus Deferrimicrobium sp.]